MRTDLFSDEERLYIPIEQIAMPSDLSIFGTHFGEATYYADFAGIAKKYTPQRVLEIGVRFGYSGIAITSGALVGGAKPPVVYVGLDAGHFEGHTREQGSGKYPWDTVAAANFARFRPGVEATFITCDTLKGLPKEVLSQRFDLINVDGDHSYEGAYGDLKQVWPLLAPGGVIIVDDLGMQDVKRAVEQFRDEHADDLEGYQIHPNERTFAIFLRSSAPVEVAETFTPEAKAPEVAPEPFREKRPYRKRR